MYNIFRYNVVLYLELLQLLIWNPGLPFINMLWLISIPIWIHTPSRLWDDIIYLFPNFKSRTIEVWKWILVFIPHFIMDVITYRKKGPRFYDILHIYFFFLANSIACVELLWMGVVSLSISPIRFVWEQQENVCETMWAYADIYVDISNWRATHLM